MNPDLQRAALGLLETYAGDLRRAIGTPRSSDESSDDQALRDLKDLRAKADLILLDAIAAAVRSSDGDASPVKKPIPAWFAPALGAAQALDGMARVERESGSKTLPWVLRFAHLMEGKLAANRHKGDREGWINDEPEALLKRLLEETDELRSALAEGRTKDIPGEAADVANFAMMIADHADGLEPGRG